MNNEHIFKSIAETLSADFHRYEIKVPLHVVEGIAEDVVNALHREILKEVKPLRSHLKTANELLGDGADALESLFVTQEGIGMASRALTRIRTHLNQSKQ